MKKMFFLRFDVKRTKRFKRLLKFFIFFYKNILKTVNRHKCIFTFTKNNTEHTVESYLSLSDTYSFSERKYQLNR